MTKENKIPELNETPILIDPISEKRIIEWLNVLNVKKNGFKIYIGPDSVAELIKNHFSSQAIDLGMWLAVNDSWIELESGNSDPAFIWRLKVWVAGKHSNSSWCAFNLDFFMGDFVNLSIDSHMDNEESTFLKFFEDEGIFHGLRTTWSEAVKLTKKILKVKEDLIPAITLEGRSMYNMIINDLDVTPRLYNFLKAKEFKTLNDVIVLGREKFTELKPGKKILSQMEDYLRENNISW